MFGESRLEKYLLDNPPNEANIPKAEEELQEAQQQITDALKANPKVNNVAQTSMVHLSGSAMNTNASDYCHTVTMQPFCT